MYLLHFRQHFVQTVTFMVVLDSCKERNKGDSSRSLFHNNEAKYVFHLFHDSCLRLPMSHWRKLHISTRLVYFCFLLWSKEDKKKENTMNRSLRLASFWNMFFPVRLICARLSSASEIGKTNHVCQTRACLWKQQGANNTSSFHFAPNDNEKKPNNNIFLSLQGLCFKGLSFLQRLISPGSCRVMLIKQSLKKILLSSHWIVAQIRKLFSLFLIYIQLCHVT